MVTIVVANAFSLAGCILMALSGLLKHKKSIVVSNSIQCALLGTSNAMLGGWTGTASDGVAVLRNIYSLFGHFNWVAKLVFCLLHVSLILPFNTLGLIGLMPGLASCIFTLLLGYDDVKMLKVGIISAQACWLSFDVSIKNYVGVLFDIFTIVTNVIGIAHIITRRNMNG